MPGRYALVPPVSTVHKGSVNHGQFAAHPEWYSLVPRVPSSPQGSGDGHECIDDPGACVRTYNISNTGVPFASPSPSSLCNTDPAMRAYMLNETLRKLRWDAANLGGVQLVSVADNDVTDSSLCHCPKCVAARERDRQLPPCATDPAGCGSAAGLTATPYIGAAGSMLDVANDLQAGIAGEFPDVRVMMQSYHATLQPPKVTRPLHGTVVQFTTLHANFGQPLHHPSNNLAYVVRGTKRSGVKNTAGRVCILISLASPHARPAPRGPSARVARQRKTAWPPLTGN